ncbi:hypothetical protein DFH09DRAFT_1287770, partial [Mycena vulgaris]
MYGSFSAITKYIHYAPILRLGSAKFQPRATSCPRIPIVEPLDNSAALRLSREDLGCRGELSFELILGQKRTQPNRAPGFPLVYKKWRTSTHHPPRLSSLTYSLPPSHFAPMLSISSVRLRTVVVAENELAALEPLTPAARWMPMPVRRCTAPTPCRNNSDPPPPLYTATRAHDAAAPNSLGYSQTHYRHSQRETASPDAIPKLRRKLADAVIPAYGRTNAMPPPLPTQTDVPSASRCLSDSAAQVWLNIDERNFDSVDFAEVVACHIRLFAINPTDLKNGRALSFTHETTARYYPAAGRPLLTLHVSSLCLRSSTQGQVRRYFELSAGILSSSFKTRKTVIMHFYCEVFPLTPLDLKMNITRETVSLLPRFETPRLSSLKASHEPMTVLMEMLGYTLLQVILKHRGFEIFQTCSRGELQGFAVHISGSTRLRIASNLAGYFFSSIVSESRGPRGCVNKRPLSMVVVFDFISFTNTFLCMLGFLKASHDQLAISTRSSSGLRGRLVFSSTTMARREIQTFPSSRVMQVSSHSMSQNAHNLSIPSNVPKCWFALEVVFQRPACITEISILLSQYESNPSAALRTARNRCVRYHGIQNLWSFRRRSSFTSLLTTLRQHLSRGE